MDVYRAGKIVEAACVAHARRPFCDLHVDPAPSGTTQGLRRSTELYGIGREIGGRPPDMRNAARQARARPLLEAMRSGLHDCLGKRPAKTDTPMAIRDTLGRQPALMRVAGDGRN